MLPFFAQTFGNPASAHHLQGRRAARAVEQAREQVAALIHARPAEVVFTSGGTESNNLAILGLGRRWQEGARRRIVTSTIEHKAVLAPCHALESLGYEVVEVPVSPSGVLDMERLHAAVDATTLLVTIQAANNEIGTLQPMAAIAAIAHDQGALLHCDAAQAVGKIPVDVEAWDVDLLSLSGHKLYGPKGVGALIVRGRAKRHALEPISLGGGQEAGLRPGSTNVAGIVGLGAACLVSEQALPDEARLMAEQRDFLEAQLQAAIPGLEVNGRLAARLPNTSSLTFPGVEADALLLNLPHVMMSTGSACQSGTVEPSHVLQAIGLSREAAAATVRASLGRGIEATALQAAMGEIAQVWLRLST